MRLRVFLATAMMAIASLACAASSETKFHAAMALFEAKRFREARAAFEKIVAAEPKHAAACHYLGRAITAARPDNAAYEEALKWLAKAVELEPDNAIYLGIYGGTSLQYASRSNSISAANRGRDALEQAVRIDPGYLQAREGLYQFYQRAPWPIGSSAKAAAHLEEIRKRDPNRATVLSVVSRTNAKDFAAAFKICENALGKNPGDYLALYHYGRTASLSGQHLERGLERLQKCLAIEPPTPVSPSHSNVWHRIGIIHERLEQPAEARTAFESAVKLDAANRQAADALAKFLRSKNPTN